MKSRRSGRRSSTNAPSNSKTRCDRTTSTSKPWKPPLALTPSTCTRSSPLSAAAPSRPKCRPTLTRALALSAISSHSSSRYSARLKSTPCCTPCKPAAARQPSPPTASTCKTSSAVAIRQQSGNARNVAARC